MISKLETTPSEFCFLLASIAFTVSKPMWMFYDAVRYMDESCAKLLGFSTFYISLETFRMMLHMDVNEDYYQHVDH